MEYKNNVPAWLAPGRSDASPRPNARACLPDVYAVVVHYSVLLLMSWRFIIACLTVN